MRPIVSKTISIGDASITFLRFDLAKDALCAQLSTALFECERLVGLDRIARQTFFLSHEVDRDRLIEVVERAYGWPTPVTSYVNQSPADGHAVSCELWAFSAATPLRRTPHMTWASTSTATWGFVGGMTNAEDGPLADGVQRLLTEMQYDLGSAGFQFKQMVRTWYYIGDILGTEEHGTRYGLFNASRNEFYHNKWPDLCGTPASTGIGMNAGQTVFEGLLIRPTIGTEVSWVDNPLQTRPYLYDIETEARRKPSFSRAAAVRLADATLTFISGTASIRRSLVIHPEDVAAQTEATIENMAALVKGKNLDDLQQIRVYIKRREDVEIVRDRCRAHLPDAPCAYLLADICKPDCLVEIEAVHFSSNVIAATAGAGVGRVQSEWG